MKKRLKYFKFGYIFFILLGLIILSTLIFMHFGGFSTGENISTEEFAKYAQSIDNITVPEGAKIIALGEATHGNIEFQKLKLDIFKQMVEEYNVKAFLIEGDYGGCEKVNNYIHGGDGTPEEAVAAIGFSIYRTDEMVKLISYMRDYNKNSIEGEDLRFYGFDMQRIFYSFKYLTNSSKEFGIDTTKLEKLMHNEEWNDKYDNHEKIQIITQIKEKLKNKEKSDKAIRFADMLLQNCKLKTLDNVKGSELRDEFMAENVEWILKQEQELGYKRIFVSGHNGHLAKWGSLDSMGKLLSKRLGSGYYVIGTDFYKTKCNMPIRSSKKRTNQAFYSHDPLAKASKIAGLDISWLDFDTVPNNSELGKILSQYIYMGSLGESYSWLMRIIPQSYRIFQPPAELYDSMIFVSDARPIKINMK